MTDFSFWLVSEISSILLGKSIDTIFAQPDPRLKSVQNAVHSILQAEQNNSYYNTLDTVLHNSTLLRDAYNLALLDEVKAKERIQEILIANKVPEQDTYTVSGVMLRILSTIKNVLLIPNSGEEQRLSARIESIHHDTLSIHLDIKDTKRSIDQLITQMGINELSSSQYDSFEESVISYYLNGELSALSDTLLKIKDWSIEKKAQLPTSIQALFYMLEIVSKYCKTSIIDETLLSSYCTVSSTSRLDKLFFAFVLSFGTRSQITLLKEDCPKDRISLYLPVFEAVLTQCNLDLSVAFSDNYLGPIYAAICLARNYETVFLSTWKNGLLTAKDVIPKPLVIAYFSILEHNTLSYQYIEYPPNSKVEGSCLSILNAYLSARPFFENCSSSIQNFYFNHFAEILITCSKDIILHYYPDICSRPIHKEKLLFLNARLGDNSSDSITQDSMNEALEEALSAKNYSSILQLLLCAHQTIGKPYVVNYIQEHLFLLKKDITLLSLALDVGFPAEILDQYSTVFGHRAEYHLLCIQYKPLTDDELKELENSAIKAYQEHDEIRGFNHIVSLIIIARKYNEFDSLESKFSQLPIAIHRHLAQYFYNNKLQDSALYHIRKVINTDSTKGDDYLLLGLVSSGEEAITAFQTGYQNYENTSCLGHLLTAQYRHNSIDPDILLAASRIDTAEMQSLVSASYSSLGNQSSALSHSIRALLLTKEYNASIFNQVFQAILFHEQGRDPVPSVVGRNTCVFLEDENQVRQYICFYSDSTLLPKSDFYWFDIRHIWADYSNSVYASLVTRPIGSTITLNENQFKIVGLSDTYAFISKHCLDELLSHNDVFALSGDINESIEKIKKHLSDRANYINECLDQYQDIKGPPIVSLRGLANRFGASYPDIMNLIIQRNIPIHSFIHDRIVRSNEFIVGFDTIFLLSLLDLNEQEHRSISSNFVISESTHGNYIAEKIKTLNGAQESSGYMWTDNDKLRLLEPDPSDPCKPYRDMYDTIDPIILNLKKNRSIFSVPPVLSEIDHDLSYLFGQETLDAFQMSSDHNCVIINDAALIWLFNNLFPNHRWGTLMDILAQSNLSINSLIACMEKLVHLRFSGVFSFNFFCTLCERLRSLSENNLSEQYEDSLVRILEACEAAKNERFFYENLLSLTHALGQSNYRIDPLTRHLVRLAINNTPDSIWERFAPLFNETEASDPE